jgi:hypothetical protein
MLYPLISAARPRALALAVVMSGAVSAAPALAQTSGEKAAAAQALFDEAMRLVKAGQSAEACPKLEESQRLDAGMATQFRLAECYEKVGKIASAWASFVAVADSAAVARLPEREAAARKRVEALAPRVPHLTLTVPPALATLDGLEVQRDGVLVARPLWGVPVPVDPGDHVVMARAPGKRPWEGRITAAETSAVGLTLVPLEDLPPAISLPPGPPLPPPRRSAAPAIVLGALAAAGVGVGAGLFVVHSGQQSDADTLSGQIKTGNGTCAAGAPAPDPRCSTLAGKASSADAFGNGSTVAFAVGGAAAVAMVTYLLWPSAPRAPASGRAIHLLPSASAGQGGLVVAGSFW